MWRDLENYAAMKRKKEVYRNTLKNKSPDANGKNKDNTKNVNENELVCQELTKWLQNNFENFIDDFMPSHEKYSTPFLSKLAWKDLEG